MRDQAQIAPLAVLVLHLPRTRPSLTNRTPKASNNSTHHASHLTCDQAQVAHLALLMLHLRRICPTPQVPHRKAPSLHCKRCGYMKGIPIGLV